MSNELIPSEHEFKTMQTMAKNAVQSKFFDKIGNEAGLLSIMLYAKELGLPIMQSLMGGMWNIQGKIELSARMMNMMIRKAGHKLEIIKATSDQCTIKGIRRDTGEVHTESLSLAEAKAQGIYKKGAWDSYPSDMLFARVISRLARRLFADVIGTAYVEGELSDQKEERRDPRANDEVIEVEESKPTTELVDIGSKLVEETKRPEHRITMAQSCELFDMVKDDPEWRKNCFDSYTKVYGYKVTDFVDLPAAQYKPLKDKIAEYKSMQGAEYANG